MFRTPRRRTIRWRAVSGEGLEHLTISPEADGIVVRGVVIGDRDAIPYGLDYTIVCAPDWTVRELDLATTAGMAFSLHSDGAGRWLNHDGRHLAEFDGCLDVDLAGTPFTNTLPIRRIDWDRQLAPVALKVLYVPFDNFVPVLDRQIYACLEPGRRFRYVAADRDFEVELAVDRDGLVMDYPGLFERV